MCRGVNVCVSYCRDARYCHPCFFPPTSSSFSLDYHGLHFFYGQFVDFFLQDKLSRASAIKTMSFPGLL